MHYAYVNLEHSNVSGARCAEMSCTMLYCQITSVRLAEIYLRYEQFVTLLSERHNSIPVWFVDSVKIHVQPGSSRDAVIILPGGAMNLTLAPLSLTSENSVAHSDIFFLQAFVFLRSAR